jgi:hypothetical protein
MNILIYGFVGAFSGLYSACWGAYKDSLFEKFESKKFARSIMVGFILGIILSYFLNFNNISKINLGVFFLFVMTFERLFTESLKAFIRNENQDKYKIPSKLHIFGKTVESKFFRLLIGLIFISLAVALFYLPPLLNITFNNKILAGIFWGIIAGLIGSAAGGAWKDASIEGFNPAKFFRSPLVGALWGALLIFFTDNYPILLFACIGGERMVVELYKTFVLKSVPGKFSATKPKYIDWIEKRKKFIIPYITSLIIFVLLLIEFRFTLSNNFIIFLGLIAGIHAASYGAYKDSPYESFIYIRFFRELLFAFFASFALLSFNLVSQENYLVIFLVILSVSRLLTEFYKLFIRTEDQSNYLIPTQFHFFKKVINNPALRLLVGLFCTLIILLIIITGNNIINLINMRLSGAIIGFLTGLATAIGGGYKDGLFEGFEKIKFFRSPIIGMLGGVIISFLTNNVILIVLGAIGFERMLVEFYKGFLKKGYSPGKFKSKKAKYIEWVNRRKIFLYSYVATWVIIIILIINNLKPFIN